MENLAMKGSEILVASEKVSNQAEVTGIQKEFKRVNYKKDHSLHSSGINTGWGLRIIRNGKIGISAEWGIIDSFRLVDKAIGNCRYGPKAIFSLPERGAKKNRNSNLTFIDMRHNQVQNYLKELESRLQLIHARATLTASLEWGNESYIIQNSKGLINSYSRNKATADFSVTLPTDNGLLHSSYSLSSTNSLPDENDILDMLLLPLHVKNLSQISIRGKQKIVLAPQAFSVLLQAIRIGVSGKSFAEKSSPLLNSKNKQVISKSLTIKDQPRLEGGASSAPFDSEGISTVNKILFQKGVFNGFIHDLNSAALCNEKSTGSSGRNLGEHSRPVCTNLVVNPASDGSHNTLSETGSGILIPHILSAGGGNTHSGDFIFDCGRVYIFKRGEIQGFYDSCVLSGNVYQALAEVNVLGSKKYKSGTDLLPFISLGGISVR